MEQCACDDTTGYPTLAEMRYDMLVDLGYATIASNPPPGEAAYCNLKLRQAQDTLLRRFKALRTERWFTWGLVAGEAFYDFPDNVERVDATCDKEIDPYRITFVGTQRGTEIVPLVHGIAPQVLGYEQQGYPTHYDVRQCIQVWPVPADTEGTLTIRGHFKPARFTQDTDRPTIPWDLVYMLALANAKAHKGQPDANNYVSQMEVMLSNYVAGTHGTRRYIPGGNLRVDYTYVAPVPTVPFPT